MYEGFGMQKIWSVKSIMYSVVANLKHVRMEIEWSSGGFLYRLAKFNKEEWTDPIGGLLGYEATQFLNVESTEHYRYLIVLIK